MEYMNVDIRQLPAQPIFDILNEVLRIRRLSNFDLEIEVPEITFYLKSGGILNGYILDITTFSEDKTILIQSVDSAEKKSRQCASYVKLSSIESITVHSIEDVAFLLSYGRISSPLERSPLTYKELEAKVQKYALFFVEEFEVDFEIIVDWGQVEEESEESLLLIDAIRDSLIGLYEFILEPGGIDYFQKNIKTVQIQTNSVFNVTKEKSLLVFKAPVLSGKRRWQTPMDIKEMVQAALSVESSL